MVGAYERGGAAALSVLTDERHFGGSLDDLRAARAACDLPILRKDFIVDPYQLYEAARRRGRRRAADRRGARATTRCWQSSTARPAGSISTAWSRSTTRTSFERALELDADVIGINNRNLDQFTVDIATTYELITDVPAGKTVVAESGISSRAELEELERVGVDAVLIGEALMRADDPEAKTRELTGVDEGTREHRLP